MTIAEAAKVAGLAPCSMRRRLHGAGVKLSGTRKKFFVTVEDLERELPEHFGPDGSLRDRLAKLERETAATKRRVNAVAADVRALKRLSRDN